MPRYKRSKTSADPEADFMEDNGFAAFGGYMEAKKAKLHQQFRHQTTNLLENKSDIFCGVSILVNGYTKPSAEELKELIGEHGGTFHQYQVLGGGTTHIIATNLPNVKINKLGSVPIVKPSWIVDSIETGRLLDYKKYLLYTNQSRTQPRLNLPVIEKPTAKIISNSSFNTRNDIRNSDNASELNNVQTYVTEDGTALITSVNKALIANINSNESSKRAKDATDPTFLTEFYNNSRLHLIASLGAEFKQLVHQLREKSDGKFDGLQSLIQTSPNMDIDFEEDMLQFDTRDKVIMHIDMDCFFVSVGLRSRPELRGKPVAVTHSRGNKSNQRPGADHQAEIDLYEKRLPGKTDFKLNKIDSTCSLSEIASCSYEARKCGIKNGMFMGPALQLCPELMAIPYEFECYKEVSHALYKTIAKYSLNIEAVSCDEMYVDVTNILSSCHLSVEKWATHIRNEISEETGCPCSTGFGSNRLQARMATKQAKPNGQFYLLPQQVESYFYEVKVGDLPGVGYATLSKLKGIGIETCGDVQSTSLQTLQSALGNRMGSLLFDQSKGIDNKPLQYEHERKSVSAEMNYGIRFKNNVDVYDFFENLAKEVHSRLQETEMRSKCVTLKLMVRSAEAPIETAKYLGHGVCDSLSRSSTLASAMCDQEIILRETTSLFEKLKVVPEDIRGVGIQLSRLEKSAPVSKLLSNFLNKAKEQSNDSKNLKSELDGEKVEGRSLPKNDIIRNECSEAPTNINDETNRLDTPKVNSKSIKTGQKQSGRGRPRKMGKLESKSKGSLNTLGNYFKVKGQSTDTSSKSIESSQNNQIDMTVLNELPEDIRSEVMKEYSIKTNHHEPDSDSKSNEKVCVNNDELDTNFLDALPDDIRKEVILDFKLKRTTNLKVQSVKSTKIDNSKKGNNKNKKQLNATKKINVIEINAKVVGDRLFKCQKDIIQDNNVESKEILEDVRNRSSSQEFDLSSLNPDDFKSMLYNWLQTQNCPLEYDTKLLSTYFYQLATSRKIEMLFKFVKFLTRIINKKTDCTWHKAYNTILNHLQEGMIMEYNHTLFIPDKINCDCAI